MQLSLLSHELTGHPQDVIELVDADAGRRLFDRRLVCDGRQGVATIAGGPFKHQLYGFSRCCSRQHHVPGQLAGLGIEVLQRRQRLQLNLSLQRTHGGQILKQL